MIRYYKCKRAWTQGDSTFPASGGGTLPPEKSGHMPWPVRLNATPCFRLKGADALSAATEADHVHRRGAVLGRPVPELAVDVHAPAEHAAGQQRGSEIRSNPNRGRTLRRLLRRDLREDHDLRGAAACVQKNEGKCKQQREAKILLVSFQKLTVCSLSSHPHHARRTAGPRRPGVQVGACFPHQSSSSPPSTSAPGSAPR